jgi:hypothetical protein
VFDAKGRQTGRFKVMQSKQFTSYESIAVTPTGSFYLNDLNGSSISYFSPRGKLLGKFYTPSDNVSIISYPAGVCHGPGDTFTIASYEMLIMNDIKE